MADWVLIIITAIYTIATIFILIANYKSVKAINDNNKLQSKIQKQNVNVQLFKKRIEIYNELKNRLTYIAGSPWLIFENINFKFPDCFNDEFKYKVQFLFFDEVSQQVKKINNILNECTICLNRLKEANDRYKHYSAEILQSFMHFIGKLELDGIDENEKEEFINLSESKKIISFIDDKVINIYDMCQLFYENKNLLEYEIKILWEKIDKVMPIDCFKDIK